jgi:hypothetical protein
MMRALTIDFPASPVAMESPTIIRPKYSGGPSFSATLTSGLARIIRQRVAKVPPMNEPMAAPVSATPPRPCFAILCPSIIVIADETSPGTPIRTVVIVPPYCEP